MKTLLAVSVIILAIIATIMFARNIAGKNATPFTFTSHNATLQARKQMISLEIAKDLQSQQKGLSGRNSLDTNTGMLFVFPNATYQPFWMKDMKFPIDIIFLQNKKVVTIFDHVPYPVSQSSNLPIYKPEQPSDMVIELSAGKASSLGIKKNDTLTISL